MSSTTFQQTSLLFEFFSFGGKTHGDGPSSFRSKKVATEQKNGEKVLACFEINRVTTAQNVQRFQVTRAELYLNQGQIIGSRDKLSELVSDKHTQLCPVGTHSTDKRNTTVRSKNRSLERGTVVASQLCIPQTSKSRNPSAQTTPKQRNEYDATTTLSYYCASLHSSSLEQKEE